ncbi:NAD-dependent deacetylase [Candidatus Ornithobacterium hominis]|uniref:protein acetyllysine N-acetyltransferase n=1 Tax=Candidatus Ornithobacterium hominis TaxID=2497989 RepID=A0A383U1H7_9FLAO|nr:NAD-dependent deacylase [Candidatus Ornithobacterium hominis]MCT7904330.1 NAD-dependent deacylase [Candidatus Ornithobacterium hominis]SZD73011.1 NAD-dependent deacetylase [Candidatus Ornithobacterium hominis]
MKIKPKIVVLTGAGISQESGLKTFRDSGGLWEDYDISQIATPEAFEENPKLVLKFYNLRKKQLKDVEPNAAHHFLKTLEDDFEVIIITQNVDDLHERAGSKNIIHLHGELKKARSVFNDEIAFEYEKDIQWGDLHSDGGQLRPHIVWFGEAVPQMQKAIEEAQKADILLIIGTSLQVYPAAGLVHEVATNVPVYLIDPSPIEFPSFNRKIHHIQKKAIAGIEELNEILKIFLKP